MTDIPVIAPEEQDLGASDREAIARLADAIVPPGNGFPSASQAGVHQKWVDRALRVRPDLRESLLRVAHLTDVEPADQVLARLTEQEHDVVEALVELIIACYYMSPKARKPIGYKGQIAVPVLPGEPEHYLRDDLLSPVATRPPMWRRTPDDPSDHLEHQRQGA